MVKIEIICNEQTDLIALAKNIAKIIKERL